MLARHPELQSQHPHKLLAYHLPPPHLFYAENAGMGVRMHNWLRIRLWCIMQVVAPPTDGKVLMSTMQWRIALEGKYFRVPFDWAASVQPKSRIEDIKKLPEAPDAPPSTAVKRVREGGEPFAVEPPAVRKPTTNRKNLKRLADRIDISVRFNVHAGFLPYSDALPEPTWGAESIPRARADTDKTLWAEIVWELSVLGFRFELLDLDREMVPDQYADPAKAAEREDAIKGIWSEQGELLPQLDGRLESDLMSLSSWQDRRIAFVNWAAVILDWPVDKRSISLADVDVSQPDVYGEWELEVLVFYCRLFFQRRGRLPTVPLMPPRSLSLHAVQPPGQE